MPNRILRDWTDSENVNVLSWQAEILFVRLMMKADDYGSFHANVKLLKASLFPLRIDTVREADISRWLDECQKAGLIVIYYSNNKSYVRILNFGQRMRNMTKRFPDYNPPQSAASCRESPPEVESEIEIEKEENRSPPANFLDSNLFRQPTIPTFDEVHRIFIQQGGTKEMAEKFYNKHEGTGWFINGSPIKNIGALISNFRMNWNNSNAKQRAFSNNADQNGFVA